MIVRGGVTATVAQMQTQRATLRQVERSVQACLSGNRRIAADPGEPGHRQRMPAAKR
ncbi:TPA: hypothetical protein QDC20_006252 [Burkholderia aenigmatica]|uniref:hypothetical protein n=1 Tax=Burkholderia sp. AU45251 TaxID=3059204 RepID=UPI002653601D|nr:hypothetical protein [Burkholderia sp. AU45251]HDR9485993.1 hypothetical protein [Burkholderia aenigmatica]MDN7518713.1 hypothetical protein [Burkholderia sp. AU45251]HDR9517709.1 hypothetical protein [Burkholderia aenigmatica]HDR9595898.1 hypothetical protein [Burkholderia aenigmatica]HDR9602947.1 hypothetical protein [Burkholderia aenigmatica]